jgi:hypothetical protein
MCHISPRLQMKPPDRVSRALQKLFYQPFKFHFLTFLDLYLYLDQGFPWFHAFAPEHFLYLFLVLISLTEVFSIPAALSIRWWGNPGQRCHVFTSTKLSQAPLEGEVYLPRAVVFFYWI